MSTSKFSQIISSCKELYRTETKLVLSVFAGTAFLWILLLFGYLPQYNVNNEFAFEEVLSYFFPIWVFAGLALYGYLNHRITNEKPKAE